MAAWNALFSRQTRPSSRLNASVKRRRNRSRDVLRRRLLAEVLEDRRVLATVAWDGGGDGQNWSDPLNWDSDALPTAGDDVSIDLPTSNPTIVIDTDDATVNRLQSDELMELRGKLHVLDSADFDGGLHGFFGGELTADGSVTLSANSFFVNAAKVNGSGRLVVAPAVSLFLKRVTIDLPIENRGSVSVQNDGLLGPDSSTLNRGLVNFPGGQFSIQDTAVLRIDEAAVFDNQGIITKTDGGTSEIRGDLINAGTIDVQSGELEFYGLVENHADITAAANTTLDFRGAFDAGTNNVIDGEGTFEFNGPGPFDFSDSDFLPTGFVDFFGFTSQVIINNTLPAEASFANIRTSIEFGADQILNGSAGFQSGTISGSGDVTLVGEWTINKSTFQGPGKLIIPQGSRLRTFGTFNNIERDIDVFGKLAQVDSTLTVNSNLHVHPTGTLELAGDDLLNTQSSTLIQIDGALSKTGAGESRIGPFGTLRSTGPVDVASGMLEISLPTELHSATNLIGTLRLNGITQTSAATSFGGPGMLVLGSGPIDLSDATIATGAIEFRGDATVGTTIAESTGVSAAFATVTLNADQHFVSPELLNTRLHGTSQLTLSGGISTSSALFDLDGSITATDDSTWNAFGSLSLQQPTTNHGHLRLRGSSLNLGDRLNNKSEGILSLESQIDVSGADGLISNEGLLSKTSENRARLTVDAVNLGIVRLEEGRLEFPLDLDSVGGHFELLSGTQLQANPLVLDPTSNLLGRGTVLGDVFNHGNVAPGTDVGALLIQGNYTQGDSGTLQIDVNAIDPGSFDVLTVTGTAMLGGTLALNFDGENEFTSGNSFRPLTFSSSTGAFGNLTQDGLSNELTLSSEVEPDSVRVDLGEPDVDLPMIRQHLQSARTEALESIPDLSQRFTRHDQSPELPIVHEDLQQTFSLASALESIEMPAIPDSANFSDFVTDLNDSGFEVICASGLGGFHRV